MAAQSKQAVRAKRDARGEVCRDEVVKAPRGGSVDVLRQARAMRDEWRRRRYARLFGRK